MHGLVDAPHVDHLHPDAGIAIATAADGAALTKEIFGDRVLWVPWRRPGFQLGLDIAAVHRANPQAIGVILGGHGITAWGATSDECEANSSEIIATAAAYLAEHGRPEPFGAGGARATARDGTHGSAPPPCSRSCAASPPRTARRSATTPTPTVVLDFVGRERMPELAALGHLLPGPLPAYQGQAARAGPGAGRAARRGRGAAQGAARGLPRRLPRPTTSGTPTADSPPMRGADPAIVLVPGVGMFCFGANKQTARVAGEFYVNAINVMRGAESVSTYAPIDESEKFRIEYWALEEAKLQRMPKPKPLATRIAFVTGGGSGHRPGDRAAAGRRGRLRGRRRPRRRGRDRGGRPRSAAPDVAVAVAADVTDGGRRRGRDPGGGARVRRGRPGRQQRRAVHLEAAAGDHRGRTGTCSTT